MGTTLTGLTPATTYDALIKVTDNGPLSATAKYLSDGLGNDSILALSSNKVGIGTFAPSQPLHVNGNMRLNGALYDNNNLAGTSGQILSSTGTATNWIDVSSLGVVDGSGTANYVSKWSDPNTLTDSLIYDNGTNVGIGTSSPAQKLDVAGIVAARNSGVPALQGFRDLDVSVVGSAGQGIELGARDGATYKAGSAIYGTLDNPSTTGNMVFQTRTADALTTKMTITQAGNVGIGTASPSYKLEVNGNAYCTDLSLPASGGIYFDNAGSKYLDDYEEGSWTPTDASGGGLTYTQATGNYTKIGREVFVRAYIEFPVTADVNTVVIGGLPFTSSSALGARGGNITYCDKSAVSYIITNTSATTVSAFNSSGVAVINANLSAAYLYYSANYNV